MFSHCPGVSEVSSEVGWGAALEELSSKDWEGTVPVTPDQGRRGPSRFATRFLPFLGSLRNKAFSWGSGSLI